MCSSRSQQVVQDLVRSDIVYTPPECAAKIVNHFRPSGSILDPCRGTGAFSNCMPTAEWCEIRDGMDFFQWTRPVDWIVSNPPYSVFARWLRHSLTLAANIVYLIPINKLYNSDKLLRDVLVWGGVPEILLLGPGSALQFPIGFAMGAVHFQRGYCGATSLTR